MNVIQVPLAKLRLWEKNPRGIKAKDYERLKKQITKLGQYKPLIAIKENGGYTVLGGNMRLRAYQEMGLKEADVSVVEAKTEARKLEYALSDNDRVGFYEEDKLAELVYPHIDEIDLGAFKVDLGEAIDLKAVVERYGPDIDDGADDVPEVDDTPAVTKTGDLFTLGKHRLLCGDSTKAEDVARLMRGEKADMVFTDPPYGIEYSSRGDTLKGDTLKGDTLKELPALLDGSFSVVSGQMRSGAAIYCFHADQKPFIRYHFEEAFNKFFHQASTIIWVKNAASMGWQDYRSQHEPILYGWKKGDRQFYGDRKQTTIWDYRRDAQQTYVHPTQKPTEIMMRGIKNSSQEGGHVLDPFLGSGTTLIAAEKTGRVCYGMEIDPKYCDVIIKRYADYTGTSEDAIRATREAA